MTRVTRSRTLSVGDLMTPDPIVIGGDEPLADAARLFDQHQIHGLPVVDADGALIGVISQTDMIRARTTEQLWAGWRGPEGAPPDDSPPDHQRGCQPVRGRGRAGGQRACIGSWCWRPDGRSPAWGS